MMAVAVTIYCVAAAVMMSSTAVAAAITAEAITAMIVPRTARPPIALKTKAVAIRPRVSSILEIRLARRTIPSL